MSELAEALKIAAVLPRIQEEEIQNLIPLLYRLPIADVVQLREAVTLYPKARTLRDALMQVRGEKVRVAEWYVAPSSLRRRAGDSAGAGAARLVPRIRRRGAHGRTPVRLLDH